MANISRNAASASSVPRCSRSQYGQSPFVITKSARRSARRCARADVQRAADQRVLGDLGADQLALDRAVVHHQHAIAAADQLVVVGGVEEDRRALLGEAAQQLVDLLLGAD